MKLEVCTPRAPPPPSKKGTPQAPPEYSDSTQLPSTPLSFSASSQIVLDSPVAQECATEALRTNESCPKIVSSNVCARQLRQLTGTLEGLEEIIPTSQVSFRVVCTRAYPHPPRCSHVLKRGKQHHTTNQSPGAMQSHAARQQRCHDHPLLIQLLTSTPGGGLAHAEHSAHRMSPVRGHTPHHTTHTVPVLAPE